MKTSTFRGIRSVYAMLAVALVVAAALPILNYGKASAGVFATRSIKMSDSTPSASAVQYDLTITPQASGSILGIVIEFCDNGPILGDATCTSTPGTDTPSMASAALSGWAKTTLTVGAANNNAVFTIGSNTWTSGTPVTLSITGMINPSNVGSTGTFYARVASYDTSAKAIGYRTANPSFVGAPIDTGGFAMSTANKLTMTAKVQEKLTFCVYTLANCAAGGTALTLGLNGVLDESIAYNNYDTKFDISTNAQTGAIVRAKTFASPGHTLTSGSNSITAAGAAAVASTVGSEQFGACFVGVGALVGVAPYNVAACNDDTTTGAYTGDATAKWAWDTGGTGTSSTFGDDFATTGGAIATSVGHINFLGNISLLSEAGIYTTDISLIATGTF